MVKHSKSGKKNMGSYGLVLALKNIGSYGLVLTSKVLTCRTIQNVSTFNNAVLQKWIQCKTPPLIITNNI